MEEIISQPPPEFPPAAYARGFAQYLWSQLWTGKDKEMAPYITSKRAPLRNVRTYGRTFVQVLPQDVSDAAPLDSADAEKTKGEQDPLSSVAGLPMLDLREGDIVEVTQRWSGEHWYGATLLSSGAHGQRGFFPLNRVRPLVGHWVASLWEFARPIPLLSYGKEQDIELLWRLNDWWSWARTELGIGVVALNYMESYMDEKEDEKADLTHPIPTMGDRPHLSKDANTPSASTVNASAKTIKYPSFPTEPPSKDHHPSFPRYRALWNAHFVDKRSLMYKRNDWVEIIHKYDDVWWFGMSDEKEVGIVQVNMLAPTTPPTKGPFTARTLYYWRPSEHNLLPTVEDEIIEVQYVFEDGYRAGTKHDGKFGLFPQNYIAPVLDRRMFEDDD